MQKTLATRVSEFLIWVLISIGLAIQLFALPQISESLAQQYSEYSSDRTVIQVMLSSIVTVAQIVLALIWLLLSRIRTRTLIAQNTLKWVTTLAASLFVAAAAFSFLLAWLIAKDTLPPGLAAVLMLATLVSFTVAMVTISLKAVLREAVSTHLELQAVI